jgi:hypothetical protein
MTGPIMDPRAGRQRLLVRFLVVCVAVAGAASLLALVLPGAAGRAAAVVSIAVIVGAPLTRVGWLAVRWGHKGDLRFAVAATAVLLVVGVGVLLA